MARQPFFDLPPADPAAGSALPVARKLRPGIMPSELWTNFGEEFRSLRTRVATALGARHKVVLVTSSLPLEGKTTTATILARSFAQMEWKTLLIDCDLRRPSLHSLFSIERLPGLTDLLKGRAREEDVIVGTDSPHLDLLLAGTQPFGPAELIQSPETPALLKSLAARYDYVVVDSPPLTSITDTLLLSGYADGILFVVRARVSPRELVKAAREQIQDKPVLGVVVNGISTPKKYGYY